MHLYPYIFLFQLLPPFVGFITNLWLYVKDIQVILCPGVEDTPVLRLVSSVEVK